MKSDNIYMDGLKFGVDNIPNGGTSAMEMKKHLEGLGWNVRQCFGDYYYHWFFTHFYCKEMYNYVTNSERSPISNFFSEASIGKHNVVKYPLTSGAFELFQDFEKLKQAKIDTKKAQRTANLALWISGGLAALQIILQLFQMCRQ